MDSSLRGVALAACRAALKPLVRMLLKHGVMHREFLELSKQVYVEIARADYGIRGRPTNVARMVLLTGIDRKEVTRVKNELEHANDAGAEQDPQRGQDRISRVLSGWHQDRDFVDGDGKPLPLPLEGPVPSYAALVKRYGGDVPATTILGELKRTAAVHVADDTVRALRRNYRLDTVDAAALLRAGSVLQDIGHTVTHNLYHGPRHESRLEARASNVNVPPWAVPAYRKFIYAEGQAFLEKVDAWLSTNEVADSEAATSRSATDRCRDLLDPVRRNYGAKPMRAGFESIVTKRSLAAAAALLVASCGIDQGGYHDPGVPDNPPPQLVLVSGPIAAFGSVHVNGLVLDTARAQIRIDGNAATQADLRLGQMIRAVALVENASTSALSIDYEDNVVGPVAALDANSGELTVLGQRVRVTATTRFDGAGLAALRDVHVGDRVAVSGIALPSGGVLATRIARAASSAPFEVTTAITALAAAGLKFELGALTVDYSQAALFDVPGGVAAPNLVVEVTGTTVTNGELVADRVRALQLLPGTFTAAATGLTSAEAPAAALAPAAATQPTAVNFVGVISGRPAPAVLNLLDLQVLLTGTTTVIGGTTDALIAGTRISVEARIFGPGQVEATRIVIE